MSYESLRKDKVPEKKKTELRNRKPGGRDPVQHANSIYRKILVTDDPVEKRLLTKELTSLKKKYDLVNPIKSNNVTKQGTTHYIFTREDWERKKKQKRSK